MTMETIDNFNDNDSVRDRDAFGCVTSAPSPRGHSTRENLPLSIPTSLPSADEHMVESPQLPLKYDRKTHLDATLAFDADMKHRSPPSPFCPRFLSEDTGPRSPIPSSSSAAPSSPLLDLRTPDPPSSPVYDRHVHQISSSPKSFWEVAFNYGPDFPYRPSMRTKVQFDHPSREGLNSRRRDSNASAPGLVSDLSLSEYSEDTDADALRAYDDTAESYSPPNIVRIVNSRMDTYIQGSRSSYDVHPKQEDMKGGDGLLLENIDAAAILLDLSRKPRISPCNKRSSCDIPGHSEVSAHPPRETRELLSAISTTAEDTSADLQQMGSASLCESLGVPMIDKTFSVKADESDSETNVPLLSQELTDNNLQLFDKSQLTSNTVDLSDSSTAKDVKGNSTSPSVEEMGGNEPNLGVADFCAHNDRGQSDHIISIMEHNDILHDPISEIFSNSLTPLSSPVEAPNDLDGDGSSPRVPIVYPCLDMSELPRPNSSVDTRHDGEKENMPVKPDMFIVPGPAKSRSASVLGLGLGISVDHNAGSDESEADLCLSSSDIAVGIANAVTSKRTRKRLTTPSRSSRSGSPCVQACADAIRPPKKVKKSKNESTENSKSAQAPFPSDLAEESHEILSANTVGSLLTEDSESIDESAKEELCGCLIQAMALSRASSMPTSSLVRLVLREYPHLENQYSQKSWLNAAEDVLMSHDVFGRIDRNGLDADDKPLETQWFYMPEKDPDQDRASILREMMPKKRNETKKHKQYFFKPPGKGSRWATEDDI